MLKPTLPDTVIDEPFDTSYEFAEANFRGWWDAMKIQGHTEIELIDYVSQLRFKLQSKKSRAAARVCA